MNIHIRTGLILEDNSDAQRYLYDILQTVFPDIVIDVASSLEEAKQALTTIKPDIALVDLNLPDGSGVELLIKLTHKAPACISVVTTIYDDDNHLFAALKAGAQGYLLKEQRKNLLIEALQGIASGKPALTPKIAIKILAHFSNTLTVESGNHSNKDDILSKREKQVLALLAKGYSTSRAAEELFLSHHTVTAHIKNIYVKLKISTRVEATHKAIQLGLTD